MPLKKLPRGNRERVVREGPQKLLVHREQLCVQLQ
jgi:hypothetical protein